MKTVKEIALDLDVSQVTIYNHIKKLDKELQGNIFKKKGVTYLDDEGIRQIKISIGLIQVPQIKQNIGIEDVVKDISDLVSENLSTLIMDNISEYFKTNYEHAENNFKIVQEQFDQLQGINEKIRQQNVQLEEQNRALMELIEDKHRSTLSKRLKRLFKG